MFVVEQAHVAPYGYFEREKDAKNFRDQLIAADVKGLEINEVNAVMIGRADYDQWHKMRHGLEALRQLLSTTPPVEHDGGA